MTGLIARVLGHALLLVAVSGARELLQTAPQTAPQPAPPPDPADDLINMMLDTDTAMLNDPPCSNTDRMYAQMLLPHEQGAVEMARWELNHGSNAQLRNISRGIITSSNLYIKQLQQALTHLPTPVDCAAPAPAPEGSSPPPAAAPPQSPGEVPMLNTINTMLAPTAALDTNPDRDWALLMTKHNQAAIDMAKVEQQFGAYKPLVTLAAQIIEDKSAQLKTFTTVLAERYATPSAAAAAGGR